MRRTKDLFPRFQFQIRLSEEISPSQSKASSCFTYVHCPLPTTDANGRFLDAPIGTCAGPPSPAFNLCVDVVQTFNILVGSITFPVPTVTRWLSQEPSSLALPIIQKAARTDVYETFVSRRSIVEPSIQEVPAASAPFKVVPPASSRRFERRHGCDRSLRTAQTLTAL